jgi:hypothetical protein
MAKQKYDGVVEAVHYKPDGQVDWVRVFERRGAIFSDRIILNRDQFVQRLKAGKKFMVGVRVLQLAGTFEVSGPVKLVDDRNKQVIVSGDIQAEQDCLEGVPRI